jgi:hypothetical protein
MAAWELAQWSECLTFTAWAYRDNPGALIPPDLASAGKVGPLNSILMLATAIANWRRCVCSKEDRCWGGTIGDVFTLEPLIAYLLTHSGECMAATCGSILATVLGSIPSSDKAKASKISFMPVAIYFLSR